MTSALLSEPKISRKMCFFEQKIQKTFAPLRAFGPPSEPHQKNQSFFASFCSQKEDLSSLVVSLRSYLINPVISGMSGSL
jgi:hypothetical protein